jgi:hypothetical protein
MVTKKQIEFVNSDEIKGPTSQAQMQLMNKIVQVAMNFSNDSLQTSLCLQAGPEKIAVACVFLAGQFANTQPTQEKSWLEVLGFPDVELLITICLQIIDLVVERKGVDDAMFMKIRTCLDKLKEKSMDEPQAKKHRID